MQATPDEGQHAQRLRVEPLRIVDDAQARLFGQQRQRGEADQEQVGRWTVGEAAGHVQGRALGGRQPIAAG